VDVISNIKVNWVGPCATLASEHHEYVPRDSSCLHGGQLLNFKNCLCVTCGV